MVEKIEELMFYQEMFIFLPLSRSSMNHIYIVSDMYNSTGRLPNRFWFSLAIYELNSQFCVSTILEIKFKMSDYALVASGSSLPLLSSSNNSPVAWGLGDHRIFNLGKCIASNCNLATKHLYSRYEIYVDKEVFLLNLHYQS